MPLALLMGSQASLSRVKRRGFVVLPYCVARPKTDPYLIQEVCQGQPLAPALRRYGAWRPQSWASLGLCLPAPR